MSAAIRRFRRLHTRQTTSDDKNAASPVSHIPMVSWRRLRDRAKEISQQTVTRSLDSRIMLNQRQSEDIQVEAHCGTRAFQISKRVGGEQKLWLHAAIHAVTAPLRPAHKLITHSGRAYGADFFFTEVTNARAPDLIEPDRSVHQNDRQCRDLDCRVPTIQVCARIGLCHADRLCSFDSFLKRAAFFYLRQHHV